MLNKFRSNNLIEAKVDFPFIIIQPQFGGKVSYIRPDLSDKINVLKEHEFINYLYENWPTVELEKFEDTFNQFLTIVLYRNGSWNIYETEKELFSFDQIVKYNKDLDEKEALENTPLDQRARPQLDKMFEARKEKRKEMMNAK